MRIRLRQFGPVAVVLVLTAVGFFIARAHGESDARHDSSHRAEIAATQVRDRLVQASTLVDGVRRYLAIPGRSGATKKGFADVGERWLGPFGLPAAAWVERVPAAARAGYERRNGDQILAPTSAGGFALAGERKTYLPATLVTGSPPMSIPAIDLGGYSDIAAAIALPQTAYRVSATPLRQLADGTRGLFLVQSALRLTAGAVEPGFVVVFLPASWLLAGVADSSGLTSGVEITVGGGSAGNLGSTAAARSSFAAAGQRFDVRVPRLGVQGAAALQPWIIAGAGVMLAVLAAALGVIAARRSRAKAEVDRLFNLTLDLIVVAGFDGYFKRVNPAFEAQLGYTHQEALARPYVEFVHPDDREATESEANRLNRGETVVSFENRYVCKDGAYRWIEWHAIPVVRERLTYAVGRDITDRRQAESDLREAEERNRALADEQAALRRVATLVAGGTPPQELFAAVTEEVGHLLPVGSSAMGRFEPDGAFTTVAAWSAGVVAFPVGRRWIPEGRNVMTLVFETERPARMDTFADASGPVGVAAREAGYRSAVGTPIMVEGRLWGVMTAATTAEQPLPPDTESRLASFTELVATAIANADSRAGLARLADQQAALRRVATLVAEGVSPSDVFSAIAEEVNWLLDAQTAWIARLDADGKLTIVAYSGPSIDALGLGSRIVQEPGRLLTAAIETGRSARKDEYDPADGPPGVIRTLNLRSTVATPIVVEGARWGVVIIGTVRERFPDDTEQRLEEFTELAATAVANAENRSELAASRARIVAASDETRRRIERDLHDGTQQRLVTLGLELRLAESTVSPEFEDVRTTIRRVAADLNEVVDELREIARGIHPAVLSEGGLAPALRMLTRRMAIPVTLGDITDDRLPEPIEVAAYYVVSEALTNATKHAHATRVEIDANVRGNTVLLSIRDDGVGGANASGGSGLVGLRDRVEALGGSIEISSPPGNGTHLTVRLPLESSVTRQTPSRHSSPLPSPRAQ